MKRIRKTKSLEEQVIEKEREFQKLIDIYVQYYLDVYFHKKTKEGYYEREKILKMIYENRSEDPVSELVDYIETQKLLSKRNIATMILKKSKSLTFFKRFLDKRIKKQQP